MDAKTSFTLLVLAVLGATCDAAKFPKSWTACKLDETHNECLKQSIQGAIPDLVKGIPRLGVLPIDPLQFNRIAISQTDRPVSLNLVFTDMNIEGLRLIKIESVKNDWKTMVVTASAPVLNAKSKYTADGKVLVLPIQGDGNCTLRLDGFTAVMTIKFGEVVQPNQKVYYKVNNMGVDFDTAKLSLHLENLFKGNKQLGDQMNLFINENWREIFLDLKPAVTAALKQAFTELATRFFTKVPKSEITPQ